jgi:hypothetical protein
VAGASVSGRDSAGPFSRFDQLALMEDVADHLHPLVNLTLWPRAHELHPLLAGVLAYVGANRADGKFDLKGLALGEGHPLDRSPFRRPQAQHRVTPSGQKLRSRQMWPLRRSLRTQRASRGSGANGPFTDPAPGSCGLRPGLRRNACTKRNPSQRVRRRPRIHRASRLVELSPHPQMEASPRAKCDGQDSSRRPRELDALGHLGLAVQHSSVVLQLLPLRPSRLGEEALVVALEPLLGDFGVTLGQLLRGAP